MDIEKIKSLVEQMAIAEAEYGCGYYSHEPWVVAYCALLEEFGYGGDWSDRHRDPLHAAYWVKLMSPPAGIKAQKERQAARKAAKNV